MKKVFKITPNSEYGGGCALVAADSVDEAKSIFRQVAYYDYIFNEYHCDINEVPDLCCNANESKVILTHIYVE